MKLVKEFIFSKAAGLQPLTLRKNNYFSYFSRFKWRTAIFQTPLDVYFWMDNELLNKMQSLASLPTFSCSKSTVEEWNTGTKYELCLKLTIKASERRQYCYLGTDSNVLLVLSLQNWNKYTSIQVCWYNLVTASGWIRYLLNKILDIHIYSPNKKKNTIACYCCLYCCGKEFMSSLYL